MQIDKLRAAAPPGPVATTDNSDANVSLGTGYPSQSAAYQPAAYQPAAPVATTDNNDANVSSGTGYPPQPAEYQPFVPPAPVPAATDNSARIAELTAEMQACATNDDFTRAMELQEQVGLFFFNVACGLSLIICV